MERAARQTAESRCASAEKKLTETEDLFNARLEASMSEREQINESLKSEKLMDHERIERLEGELSYICIENASLEQ